MREQEFVDKAKQWVSRLWVRDCPVGKLERILGLLSGFEQGDYDGKEYDLERLCSELDSFDINGICFILNKYKDWNFYKCLVDNDFCSDGVRKDGVKSDDLISRSALRNRVLGWFHKDSQEADERDDMAACVIEAIDAAPTIQPEVRRAR